jgi:hypothetical protein
MNLSVQVERVLEERSRQLILAGTEEQRANEPSPSSSVNEPKVKAFSSRLAQAQQTFQVFRAWPVTRHGAAKVPGDRELCGIPARRARQAH